MLAHGAMFCGTTYANSLAYYPPCRACLGQVWSGGEGIEICNAVEKLLTSKFVTGKRQKRRLGGGGGIGRVFENSVTPWGKFDQIVCWMLRGHMDLPQS